MAFPSTICSFMTNSTAIRRTRFCSPRWKRCPVSPLPLACFVPGTASRATKTSWPIRSRMWWPSAARAISTSCSVPATLGKCASAVPTRLAKRASERFREIAVIKSRTNRFIWPAAVEGTKSRFARFKTKDDLLKQVGTALGGHGREAGGDRFPPRHGHSSLRPERLICEQARDQLRVQGVAGLVRLDARQQGPADQREIADQVQSLMPAKLVRIAQFAIHDAIAREHDGVLERAPADEVDGAKLFQFVNKPEGASASQPLAEGFAVDHHLDLLAANHWVGIVDQAMHAEFV